MYKKWLLQANNLLLVTSSRIFACNNYYHMWNTIALDKNDRFWWQFFIISIFFFLIFKVFFPYFENISKHFTTGMWVYKSGNTCSRHFLSYLYFSICSWESKVLVLSKSIVQIWSSDFVHMRGESYFIVFILVGNRICHLFAATHVINLVPL